MVNRPHGQLVTIGELTVDDVVVEDQGADWKQAGGGGLYSAVGALTWSDDVALSSVIGEDYPEELLSELRGAGLQLDGVIRSGAVASIGLWLLYERDGTRRQLEKRSGGTFAEVDAHRHSPYACGLNPTAIHVAPQSSSGQVRALEQVRGRDVVRTLDVLIEPAIERDPYLSGELFHDLDAFLPSEQEVDDLWGHSDIRRLAAWLSDHGSPAVLVIKRGAAGVDVHVEGTVTRVPSVVSTLVDPTGAGDAFCGGFLAGLRATGDPVEAAVRGCVSSSFVCETRGALAAAAASHPDLARARADILLKSLREAS